jgi:hypothetical protein
MRHLNVVKDLWAESAAPFGAASSIRMITIALYFKSIFPACAALTRWIAGPSTYT